MKSPAPRITRILNAARRHPLRLLVGLPAAIFAIPALADHMLISDDNLVQNYPLRVLVGRYLRHGHLPLWDPYIWSGAPLLAGFNAGAAFPATWLFVVLPSRAAFALTEVLVFALAAVGMYLFLRLYDLSKPISTLGAATYAFGGFMSAQLVHIDLVESASLVPWALIALRRFATRGAEDRGWRWAVMLAGVVGLIILAGAPEATINAGMVVVVYGLSLALRHRDRWPSTVAMLVGSLAGAVAIGAVQLVPGLVFAGQSQRTGSSFTFYSAGSLDPHLGFLALIPYLLGGYGRMGVPIYFGSYNLAEVTSYVGILPAIAAFGLLVPLFRRERVEWRVWYVVLVIGALMALGGYTPLGHVFAHLPVLGSQRLQSRNLLACDLALAVLFAFWLDRLVRVYRPGSADRSRISVRAAGQGLGERIISVLPVGTALVLYVLFLAWGPGLVSWLGAVQSSTSLLHPMIPYLTIAIAIVLSAGYLALFPDRIQPRRLLGAVTVITVLDLGLLTVYQSWLAPAPSTVVDATDSRGNTLAAITGPDRRFAAYNPQLYNYPEMLALGAPDLNILRDRTSIQGYGSLVSGGYQQATGTHDQATLFPQILNTSVPDELNLGVLVSRPLYFFTQLSGSGGAVRPPPSNTSTVGGPPPAEPPAPLLPGQQRTWFLGTTVLVTGVQVGLSPAPPGRSAEEAPAAVGIISGSGDLTFPEPQSSRTIGSVEQVSFNAPLAATGIVVTNHQPTSVEVAPPHVSTWDQGELALNGALQDQVKPPQWRFAGNIDQSQFGVFINTEVYGRYWLAPPAEETGAVQPAPPGSAPGSVELVSQGFNGAQTYRVVAPAPVTLVRSEAYAAGWKATVSSASPRGGARTETVRQLGLVQGVSLPAGSHTVTFQYRPADVTVGLAVSLVAWLALAGCGVVWIVVRRRRPRPSDDSEQPARTLARQL